MRRADEAALEVYPVTSLTDDTNALKRKYFAEGYTLAESRLEEKAMAYDKSLEIAKRNFAAIEMFGDGCSFSYTAIRNTFVKMFPELLSGE